MSKKRKKTDDKQLPLPLGKRIESHLKETEEILHDIRKKNSHDGTLQSENHEEPCMALAVACKYAVKQSGMKRNDVADKINEYFGWPTAVVMKTLREKHKDDKEKLKGIKHLSPYMFDHYLSKPIEYPVPGYLIYAIQYVTGSLEPCRSLAEAEQGEVVSKTEREILTVGKLFETKVEASRLLNEFSRDRRKG